MTLRRSWLARGAWVVFAWIVATAAGAQQRTITVVVERLPNYDAQEGVSVWIENADGGTTKDRGEIKIVLPSTFKGETRVIIKAKGWHIVFPPDGYAPIPQSESCPVEVWVVRENEQLVVTPSGVRGEPARKAGTRSERKQQNFLIPENLDQPAQQYGLATRSGLGHVIGTSFHLQKDTPNREARDDSGVAATADLKAQAQQYYLRGRYGDAESLYMRGTED